MQLLYLAMAKEKKEFILEKVGVCISAWHDINLCSHARTIKVPYIRIIRLQIRCFLLSCYFFLFDSHSTSIQMDEFIIHSPFSITFPHCQCNFYLTFLQLCCYGYNSLIQLKFFHAIERKFLSSVSFARIYFSSY